MGWKRMAPVTSGHACSVLPVRSQAIIEKIERINKEVSYEV